MKRKYIYTAKISPADILFDISAGVGVTISPILLGAYSLLLRSSGVWGWGYNVYGQLGDNSTKSRCIPVSILGAKKTFCKIGGSYNSAISMDYNNQVWGWGDNTNGQLGDNTVTQRLTPVSILGDKKTFCQISVGYRQSMGITQTGQVWGWGDNTNGQLGDNTVTSRRTPVFILGTNKTFCQISTAWNYTVGLTYTGQVWGWGYNDQGQLGNNTQVSRRTPVSILGTKKTFCQISAKWKYSMGITQTGQVLGWGDNTNGQLGINSSTNKCTPVSILGAKKTFCQISAGVYHSLGITYTGQVWGWGYNIYGQLGDNSTTVKYTPVSIMGAKKTFCKISAGLYHSLGIDYLGKVWSWGYNVNGTLGIILTVSRCTPVSILGANKTFCSISTGQNDQSAGVDYTGQVWGWGSNANGQLGNNAVVSRYTPVSILGAKKTFCQIYAGGSTTMGLTYTGQVWCWGSNSRGQLGDFSGVSRCTPVSLMGAKKTFCKITSGNNFNLGVTFTGQVWCWGYNGQGQLGDNSITGRCVPVSILGVKKTFCEITAGKNFSLGIDYTGQTWGWGYNTQGQLGDNSITGRCVPVSILGAKKTFCKISGGDSHTIGLEYNGQIWCWGSNINSQLGNGPIQGGNTSRRTPVSIWTNKTFCFISAGSNNSMAITQTGQVWGWGLNDEGQLGDNTEIERDQPVSIKGAKKTFCMISTGSKFTLAVDYLNRIWGWGNNNTGQLGNTINSYTPLQITTF